MSKKFVRNITNTRIKGAIQEPLNTNIQNDLLSDGEDVAVRNKDEYHLLTDNVKSITSGNDGIKVKVTGKNSRELVAKIVELTTETDEVSITNPETNVFTIDIDFSGYTDKTLFESELEKYMPISDGVLENYREKLITVSESNGSIDLSIGNVFQHTPNGDITYSITNAVNAQGHSFTLIINMGSTVRTLTFPSSVKWQGGEIPDMSTANKTYVLTFITVNGGTDWLGMFGGEF